LRIHDGESGHLHFFGGLDEIVNFDGTFAKRVGGVVAKGYIH
jgi:hypothetical protein